MRGAGSQIKKARPKGKSLRAIVIGGRISEVSPWTKPGQVEKSQSDLLSGPAVSTNRKRLAGEPCSTALLGASLGRSIQNTVCQGMGRQISLGESSVENSPTHHVE